MKPTEPLSDAEIEELTTLLEARRVEVEAALSGASEDAKPVSLDEPIGRLTRMDAIQQQHMASARKQALELQRKQIASALSRLKSGDYGDCIRCEEPIGYARLRARPETPLCLSCQEATTR